MTPNDALAALQVLLSRSWGIRSTPAGWVVDDERGRQVLTAQTAELDRLVLDAVAARDAASQAAEERKAEKLLREGYAQGNHPRPRATVDAEGNPSTEWDLYDVAGKELSRGHGSPTAALLAGTQRVRTGGEVRP
jgi:hypothetical protein